MSDGKVPSRGIRNNNPGNIRRGGDVFQGEEHSTDPEFKRFKSMAYGYRAVFKILDTYKNKYKLDTIRKMVTRWAPPSDGNDTEAYIRAVVWYSGIAEGDTIDTGDRGQMTRIVAAMSRVENGKEADYEQLALGWQLLYWHG